MDSFWYRLIASLAALTICMPVTLCTESKNTQENLEKLAKANNYLALNMLHQLSSESSKNIFFSPLSLSTVFGMLYYGTKGEAAQELRNALGYENANLPEELVHEAFKEYLTVLVSQDPSTYVLNIANSILLNKKSDVHEAYIKDIQNIYQASVKDVDFKTESQQVIQDVNSWVKNETNGNIEKMLDNLDPSTSLILLNAIYFKGTWQTQFKPFHTKQEIFYNNGLENEAHKVPMMKLTAEFFYTKLDDAKVLEMPYKGDNVTMVILLPKERDGLETLEKNLTLEKWSAIRNKFSKTKIPVNLPKFKIDYSREMANEFQSLGAKSIFEPGADFSGITPSNDIFVTQVLHKAVVEVNEEGSEAAAVTRVTKIRKMGVRYRRKFIADHPFLFAIVDKRDGMILFVGHVTNL